MTVSEAAARLGLRPATVYRLCQRGDLGCYRYGRRVVIEESDLIEFKARHRSEVRCELDAKPPTRRKGADGAKVMEEMKSWLKNRL